MKNLNESWRAMLFGGGLLVGAGAFGAAHAQVSNPAFGAGTVEGVIELPQEGTVGQLLGVVVREGEAFPDLTIALRLYNGLGVNGQSMNDGTGEVGGWILNGIGEPIAFLTGQWMTVDEFSGQLTAHATRGIQGHRFEFLDEVGPHGILTAEFFFADVGDPDLFLPAPPRQLAPEARDLGELHEVVPPGQVTIPPQPQPDPELPSPAPPRQPAPELRDPGDLHETVPPGQVTVPPGPDVEPEPPSAPTPQPMPQLRDPSNLHEVPKVGFFQGTLVLAL